MRRRTRGLLLLGATAALAGCGGGGSQNPASPGRFVPPAAPTYTMTTASLTVQIPARGTQAKRRNPKWISPGSATLGVRVLPSPIPNPTPTEQSFALPSPGPVPTSTTLTVAAPVASDTFVVTAYDGSGHPLSTGASSVTTIAANGTNVVPIALQGVASGVLFTVNSSSTPAAWRVLTNLGADQTASISAAPVDAQNNLIPGTLAAPAPISGTGGVTLPTASITGATTLTATYPHGTSTQGSVTSPLALNVGASSLNVAATADSYVFALNNDYTVQIIDVLSRTQVGAAIAGAPAGQVASLSGCNTGAFAVEGASSTADIISLPAPTVANPTPAPVVNAFDTTLLSASPIWNGLAGDNACNLYANTNDGGVYPLVKFSGFDSTVTANTTFATGFYGSQPLAFFNGQINQLVSAPTTASAMSVPVNTGGPAATSAIFTAAPGDSVGNPFLLGNGSSVFLVANTCTGQPVLQALSGGPAITLSEFAPGGGCCAPIIAADGGAQASDGTLYIAGKSVAAGNAEILAFAPLATIGDASTPSVALAALAKAVAITPDQQFVCVLEAPTGTSGQIEFFQRAPTPTLVGTVALSSSATPNSFSIGP